jgi:hypothetical protein
LLYFIVSYRMHGKGIRFLNGAISIVLVYNLVNPILDPLEFRAYQTSPFTAFSKQSDADIITPSGTHFPERMFMILRMNYCILLLMGVLFLQFQSLRGS